MLATPDVILGVGVILAVNTLGLVLLAAKSDRVPPMLRISATSNPTGTSENAKVSVAVWPVDKLELLLLMLKLGAWVSAAVVFTLRVGLAPAPPELPAASK